MPSTIGTASRPARPVPRDWAAEIDAAIAAVTGPQGPVTVAAGTSAPRRIEFQHCEGGTAGGTGWCPFRGDLGELSAEGSILRVGLGPAEESSAERVRHAALLAGAHASSGDLTLRVPAGHAPAVSPICDGIATSFPGPGRLRLLVEPAALADAARGVRAADAVRLARALVNAPANVLTPRRAAQWAGDMADRAGLEFSVLAGDEIQAGGLGALAAIGRGSVNEPALVRLAYEGAGRGPRLSLVGKGITFDSGGLSLKSPAAMQPMRMDVAGAATVLAVMGALPRAGLPISVHAVLPFAENLPGPGAARPGDVVTAWNGTQIQILDTDFEGRVVLADALALAASENPDLLVDLATLTYQAEVALGPEIAAVLGRDDDAVGQVLRAAAAAGEPMWPLPWAPRYLDQVRTPFGVRNHPLHDSGRALTAALFLGEFVPAATPWVHCDMTGPAWTGDASHDGATGFAARTLLQLVENLASAAAL